MSQIFCFVKLFISHHLYWKGKSHISLMCFLSHHGYFPWIGNSHIYCSTIYLLYVWKLTGPHVFHVVHICAINWLITVEIMHILLSFYYAASWINSSKAKTRHIPILYLAKFASCLYYTNAFETILNSIYKHYDKLDIVRQVFIYFLYCFRYYIPMSYTLLIIGKRICHCEIKLTYHNDIYMCKRRHKEAVSQFGISLNHLNIDKTSQRTYCYIMFTIINRFLSCDILHIVKSNICIVPDWVDIIKLCKLIIFYFLPMSILH